MKKFITKCDLHCNIKGYDGEKKAAFIAGRLEEPAFDVYMALPDEEKKDPEKIKTALLQSFDNAKRNREVALEDLTHRRRLGEEKSEVFAHKILELVNYAYPKFSDEAKKSLAKDHYVKGLGVSLQNELRKLSDYEDKTLEDLVKQTTYLEIADTNATASVEPRSEEVLAVNACSNSTDARLDRLINLMEKSMDVRDYDEQEHDLSDQMNYVGNPGSSRYPQNFVGNQGRPRYPHNRPRQNSNNNNNNNNNNNSKRCRACNGTGHLFRKCPKRFCQSCGKQGHDGWQKECPKYQ